MPQAIKKLVAHKMNNSVDWLIFGAVFILVSIGIMMIYSSSYYIAGERASFGNNRFHFVLRQSFAVIIGVVGMWIASHIDYRNLKKLILPGYILACGMLVYVRLFGEVINNVRRWISIGPLSFQPSEFAKVMVILMLALYISGRKVKENSWKNSAAGLAVSGAIIALPVGLVLWGRNLSTAIIIMSIGLVVIFVTSKFFWRYIILAGSLVSGLLSYLFLIARPAQHYHWDRYMLWRDPFADPMGIGYQTIQSLYAVASGGWFGLGLGNSNQKLMFMPEPYNDFIFAIIVEELGFFGALIVLSLFGVLIWRGIITAMKATDMFGTIIAMGAMVLISVQVAINVGVVTNSIPNTGIPMPFISYGGTSVVFILGLMGILLNISRQAKTE